MPPPPGNQPQPHHHAAHQPSLTRAELRTLPHRTGWAWKVATFFGAGFLRPGPGTYASVFTALLWLAAAHLLRPSQTLLSLGTLAAAVLATLVGIPAATIAAREAAREDPGFVVIDEVAGQLVALLGLAPRWPEALLAVLLFRFFDILKPPPVRQMERFPAGTGIMLDDLVAGAFAAVMAHVLLDLLQRLH